MEPITLQAAADAKDALVKTNRMKGMKIRDEFICPITYELMREPMVASDGHTYEKNAIEKWLKSSHTSPRNGEPIDNTLIPNYNLKKLIQDIINEGGSGFYTNDTSNKDRLFDVLPEKVLLLECLGPPESDWNQQSFQVNRFGCIGGRKHNPEDNYQTKEIVLFKDITVSRRHFEITQNADANNAKHYSIRDLGSAGGTFIRIAYGSKKQLHPGMIILLGKHQFTVSSIDDWGESAPGSPAHSSRRRSSQNSSLRKSAFNSEVLMSLVENAEKIIADISREAQHSNKNSAAAEGQKQKDELSARLKNLTIELTNHLTIDEAELAAAEAAEAKVHESKEAFLHHENSSTVSALASLVAGGSGSGRHTQVSSGGGGGEDMKADSKCATISEDASARDGPSPLNATIGGGTRAVAPPNYNSRRCTLTCCAPDGSPLQGKSFIVSPDGAVMGRKFTNTIALFMKVVDGDGEERIVNVDTAISSEHARVEFDDKTGRFFICDGTATKSSTNGTWYRLSGPHQESPPHTLQSGTEVLIGTVRFQVRETMTISEHKVESKSFSAFADSNAPNAECAAEKSILDKLADSLKEAEEAINPKKKDTDPVEEFINNYGPFLQSIGFGGFMGVCTGVAFKRLGNQVAYVIGLSFVGLQSLVYLGYIKVDYKKINDNVEQLKRAVDLDKDGKLTSKDLACAWREVRDALAYNLPSAGGFSMGLLLGLYFGN